VHNPLPSISLPPHLAHLALKKNKKKKEMK
jgi:hypothetical protein